MASRGIIYRGVTESAWPSVREIIRKFETLGLESRRSANNANQSVVANVMLGPKESGRGGNCSGTDIRHRDVSAQFSKGTLDRCRRASETTSKLTYVLDDTSFVCPCCQRCYRCPIAAAAKAAGYNEPCTGKQPGDLSAQFGRGICDGRRKAPETPKKLSDVLDDSSFECPRCQRNHRCPFIVAAKAAHYIEPTTGRQPGGLSEQFGIETCGGRQTTPETAEKLSYVMDDSSLVCPRCLRRYRCPFAVAAKAAQSTEPNEITLRENPVKSSNRTEGFLSGVTSEYSFYIRPSVDRRPMGFVRRSVDKIEALLLCKK